MATSPAFDPRNPDAYPSGEVGGPPPSIVRFPDGSQASFPGHLSAEGLNAAASQVWQALKTRAGNVAKNVEAGVAPIVQDVADVSAPAVAQQLYRKLKGQPNTLNQVPGKVVALMAPLVAGPEAALEDEALSTPKPVEESTPELSFRTTRGQVANVHKAMLTDASGKEVGHVSVIEPVGEDHWTINTVDLNPELRGKGLGKQLYSKILDEAQREGVIVRSSGVRTPEAERLWQSLAKQYPDKISWNPRDGFVADFRKRAVTPEQATQMAREGKTIELFRQPTKVKAPALSYAKSAPLKGSAKAVLSGQN